MLLLSIIGIIVGAVVMAFIMCILEGHAGGPYGR
jgi:hypothetical protein